jgi:hypothetical protein
MKSEKREYASAKSPGQAEQQKERHDVTGDGMDDEPGALLAAGHIADDDGDTAPRSTVCG